MIDSLDDAINHQVAINALLQKQGIKDLVGDYGELLVATALGGIRQLATTKGFDLQHPEYGRIEIKTRQFELKADGKVVKENRAVGFKHKENGFDMLAHLLLDTNYAVVSACLVRYDEVWPEIAKRMKVSYQVSSQLPSSEIITDKLKLAEKTLRSKNVVSLSP